MKAKHFRIAVVAALLLVVAAAVFYLQIAATDRAEDAQVADSALTDLESFAQFGASFQSDSGYVRLISILSPV